MIKHISIKQNKIVLKTTASLNLSLKTEQASVECRKNWVNCKYTQKPYL